MDELRDVQEPQQDGQSQQAVEVLTVEDASAIAADAAAAAATAAVEQVTDGGTAATTVSLDAEQLQLFTETMRVGIAVNLVCALLVALVLGVVMSWQVTKGWN